MKASASSLLLGWLYPALAGSSLFAYGARTRARQDRQDAPGAGAAREILRLNLHPTILFGKHLFLDFKKEHDWREQPIELYKPRDEIC